jgi:hypothetical protein
LVVGEHIGPQDAENGLEDADRDQADHQDVERAHAAMHQHLVDDDLEEHRRDQRKELEKERGDQHLAEQSAIFLDRAQEPGDIKPSPEVDQPGAPCHQDEAAIPRRFELGSRHQRRPLGIRRLDEDLVLANLAEQQKPAIAQSSDCGQRRTSQPVPSRPGLARLQAELPGAAQHLGHADRVGAELMADLRRIDAEPVEAQQHHERGEPPMVRNAVASLACHVMFMRRYAALAETSNGRPLVA